MVYTAKEIANDIHYRDGHTIPLEELEKAIRDKIVFFNWQTHKFALTKKGRKLVK